VRRHSHTPEIDPRSGRFPEQIVRDAAADGEVEELPSAEALATAAGLNGGVNHEGERTGGTKGRRTTVDRNQLHLIGSHRTSSLISVASV
jgi:hypothetical protein